jgi:hypothetical protein
MSRYVCHFVTGRDGSPKSVLSFRHAEGSVGTLSRRAGRGSSAVMILSSASRAAGRAVNQCASAPRAGTRRSSIPLARSLSLGGRSGAWAEPVDRPVRRASTRRASLQLASECFDVASSQTLLIVRLGSHGTGFSASCRRMDPCCWLSSLGGQRVRCRLPLIVSDWSRWRGGRGGGVCVGSDFALVWIGVLSGGQPVSG